MNYTAMTNRIRVSVNPSYLDDQSAPQDNHYVWAYEIRIENLGREAVTLRSRYWKIIDARGEVHEIRGVGVTGEQPRIDPGDVYEYTSGTPLSSSSAIMCGSYQMENERGEMFDVDIPAFSLDSIDQPIQLN